MKFTKKEWDALDVKTRNLLEEKGAVITTAPKNSVVLLKHKEFIKSLKIIDGFASEALLRFNKEGMRIVVLDPATVALLELRIEKIYFENYTIQEEGATLRVRIRDLLLAFTNHIDKPRSTIMWNEDDEEYEVCVENETQTRRYTLEQVDNTEKERTVPDWQKDVKTTTFFVDGGLFKKEFLITTKAGESTTIEINNDTGGGLLHLSSQDDEKQTSTVFPVEEYNGVSCRGRYSQEYIKKFYGKDGFHQLSKNNRYELATNYPLQITAEWSYGALTVVLAPRVED